MNDLNYRLDRTTFQSLTFEEADQQMKASATILEERIKHFNYLVSIAFRFVGEPWPRMDRTAFEMIKRN